MKLEAIPYQPHNPRSCIECNAEITGHGNRVICYKCRRRKAVKRAGLWQAANPDRHRLNVIRCKYKLEPDEYQEMLAGGCNACHIRSGKLCIDHDHNTGFIRGVLCDNCNKALGHLGDSVDRIVGLLEYKRGVDDEA